MRNWALFKWGSSTSVVLRVGSASPGSSLEIQIIRLHPDLQKHELWVGTQTSGWGWYSRMCENHEPSYSDQALWQIPHATDFLVTLLKKWLARIFFLFIFCAIKILSTYSWYSILYYFHVYIIVVRHLAYNLLSGCPGKSSTHLAPYMVIATLLTISLRRTLHPYDCFVTFANLYILTSSPYPLLMASISLFSVSVSLFLFCVSFILITV